MVAAAENSLVEVDRVGALGVIGPTGELVALAGGGEGLAGDAIGVGHALHGLVAVGEDTAVGDVEDVNGSVDSPAGEQRGMAGASNDGGVEVHGISAGGVVAPASEVIALAGGSQRLAGITVSVSDALHGAVAVSEDATVGDVENLGLLSGGLDLRPAGEQRGVAGASDDGGAEINGRGAAGVIVPASELVALLRGGEGLTGITVGVGHALLHDVAISEDAAVGDIENAGLLSGGIDLARVEVSVGVVGQGGNSRAAECQGTSQACGRHRATNIELGHTTTLSLAANLIEARHSNGTPNDEEHVPH